MRDTNRTAQIVYKVKVVDFCSFDCQWSVTRKQVAVKAFANGVHSLMGQNTLVSGVDESYRETRHTKAC